MTADLGNLRIRSVPYRHRSAELTGELHSRADAKPAPGLLLIHGGAGLDEHARGQAARYAALGFVVLACDMLGDEVRGDRGRIIAALTAMRDDPELLAGRARAGLAALAAAPEVDRAIGAIGFCFGGMAALALARSGAELDAAISVHGSLSTPRPARARQVRARVLVCHGARDPHVPMSDVVAFTAEMDAAEADWQMVVYGGAVHGFTHTQARPGAVPGVAYSRPADERSFDDISRFLASVANQQPA